MSRPGGAHQAGRDRSRFRLIPRFFLLFLLVLSSIASPAWAQPSPRAAVHEDFVRIVFDWDAPVGYSAEIVNGQLLVRFDRPIKGDVQSLTKPLAKVVRGVSVSDDGLAATFQLIKPMAAKAFTGANNSVVIDLTQSAAPAGEKQASAPAPSSTAPSPAPASGPPPSSASGPPVVDARAGDHGGYTRIVFDWPGPVGYSAEKQGGKATITFTKPGRIDLPTLKSGLPSDIAASLSEGGKGVSVALQVPPDTRLRHFTSGNKVVVDVVRAAGADAPPDSAKVPLAPAPGTDVAQPAIKPMTPQAEAPKTPEETLKNGLSPVKPTNLDPKAKPPAATTAAAAPGKPETPGKTEAPAPAQAAPAPAKAIPAGPVYSLSVPMTKPSAAAVFERAGYLWIVLDRRAEADTTLLKRLGGESVLAVEQLANKDATVLRLVVKPGFYPSMRKEGLLWIVDLTEQPSKPRDIIPVAAPANLPGGVGMAVKAPDSGSLITVVDPEIGDTMKVVPVIPVGQGVYPGRDAPDLELLDTTQGIVIIPHVDGLDIRSTRGGVTIGTYNGSGLRFSSELDTAPKDAAAASSSNSLFDIASWKRGGPDTFEANRQIVLNTLSTVSASKRALAHLQAARFFLANAYPAEALGYLRMAAVDQPDLAQTPGFKVVKGGAEALLAQWDLARADLDDPALVNDAETQMWRGYAHIGDSETPGDWDKLMAPALPLLKGYSHRLKWKMAAAAVVAGVGAGDQQAANDALNLLDREEATKAEEPERYYLHGIYDQMVGHFEKAIDEFDSATEGDNREFRALARFAETELQLQTRKISPKEAADQLDKLRFSWREEAFEFNLLLRYAQLQREAGDYPSALRALRSLINYYPDDKSTPKAVQMMSDIFKMLYLQGGADSLSPISAIGLFDEFRDLTPTGPEGDEMIRKLADRLAKVDLLDRAAELLKHQVTYRLNGLDKGRVGAQLALLDLMNQQPQAAVDGLAVSEVPGEPDELVRQRRHLKARALSDLDKTSDAIHALDGDNSPEAAQLRSEIHWKAQDWPAVAADFEAMVPRPERNAKLDDQQAKTCLSWATALVLANDERGLAGLRRNYGPAMSGTPYAEGFGMLTSSLDRTTPDMPAIAAKIKEVEGFKGFLSDYRKRMQDGGLSAIN